MNECIVVVSVVSYRQNTDRMPIVVGTGAVVIVIKIIRSDNRAVKGRMGHQVMLDVLRCEIYRTDAKYTQR